jgi:hypothetical protein
VSFYWILHPFYSALVLHIFCLPHVDSALIRGQEHELMRNNIPFTDNTFASLLATGSVLSSFLVKIFIKPTPFDERGQKSLTIEAGKSVVENINDTVINGDLSATYLQLLVFDGDLTVNPDNYKALLKDVDTMMCNFTIGKTVATDLEFATYLLEKLQTCGTATIGKVCPSADCTQDEENGDFYGCDCDLVVGLNAKSLTFISTVAYKDSDMKFPNDIQLLGLYNVTDTGVETTLVGFPLNSPVTPSLIPRFRNFEDFSIFINDALKEVMEGVNVTFVYSPGDSNALEDPTFSINIIFTRKKEFEVSFDGSFGLGGTCIFYEFDNFVLKEQCTHLPLLSRPTILSSRRFG